MAKLTVEKARQEATAILDADRAAYQFRSCWNCNPAHAHLKKSAVPVLCFGCGRWYFKGIDITEEETEALP